MSAPGPASGFDAETALEPVGEGRWRAHVSESWFVGSGPNGGFAAALAARAMDAMGERPPRSLTLHYLEPPAAGPVELSCTVERSGGATTFMSLRFEQAGRPFALGLGACAAWRDDEPEWLDAEPPGVPPPGACEPFPHDDPEVPEFVASYELRWTGIRPDARPASVTAWLRSRDPRPLDAPLAAAMTDALLPPAFVRASGLGLVPTIDLTIHWRDRFPDEPHPWVLGHFTTRMGAGGVCEEDGTLWTEAGRLVAQSRQLAVLRRGRRRASS